MTARKVQRLKSEGRRVATRRAIQDTFLMRLNQKNFSFRQGEPEPWGVQSEVLEVVNKMRYGDSLLVASRETVSRWCAKVRENDYKPSDLLSDYTGSAQNASKWSEAEQKQLRKKVLDEKLKSNEVDTLYSVKKNAQTSISESTVRRFLKRKYEDEPSMVAAVPKPMKIGGVTPHHNRCRLVEAEYWLSKPQSLIEKIWFADEKKVTFREHPNRSIDITWAMRGTAGRTGFYDCPRWPGQTNLYLLQSVAGIEHVHIYDKNMTKADYIELLQEVGPKMRAAGIDGRFSIYLHDNLWRNGEPIEELDIYIGRGRYTRYMGAPCTTPHDWKKTPIRKIPTRVANERCDCEFPLGPIHASFNPKLNLVEETFARIDRQMLLNKRADALEGNIWPMKGSGKKSFWTLQLVQAIEEVNRDTAWFRNQYRGFKERCRKQVISRGKRLLTQKY